MYVFSRKFLIKLMAIAMGTIFGLFIAEIALRLIGYSRPDFYRPSQTLGYELTPGMTGWYSKEGRSWVEINNDGMRDVEHLVDKPAGTLRVAVIGDSYVEALQVSLDERFTNFLESGLSTCSGQKAEVLAFGVSGYGTAQELLMARVKAWKYKPDIVLLLVTTNNDIADNSRPLKTTAIPYFVLNGEGVSLDNSFLEDRGFIARSSSISRLGVWFKNNLRVIQGIGAMQVALKYKWNEWRAKPPTPAPDATSGPSDAPMVGDVGIDSQIYRPPSDKTWEDAWTLTEKLIDLFKDDADKNAAKFIVVTGSNGPQVLPNVDERAAFAKLLGVPNLKYPDDRIAEYCATHSIISFALVDELGEVASRNNTYLHGFTGNLGYGHWNQVGHLIAGQLMARHVCELYSQP